MPAAETMIAFALISAGIMVIPGPSNVFLLAHGFGHGRRAAFAAAVGIQAASAIRVLLTAAGLSALLASSAVAFTTIRWAGVAYLAYLAVQSFRSAPLEDGTPHAAPPAVPWVRSARDGLLVGLGNPKMVIFFLAFLPQFVEPSRGSEAGQLLVLGSIFWAIGAVWDLAFAWASSAIGSWMRRRARVRAVQPRVEGCAYLGLAGWAAVSGSRPAA